MSVAPAPTRDVPRTAPIEAERNWYGWQLMINDFVALGALGGAAIAGLHDKAALGVIVPAAVVFDLGGPTIHWLHHRRGIAAASFGVRAGVPLVGVLIGNAFAHCERGASSCSNRGAGYGALAGFAAAIALDASLLAWDAPKSPPRPSIGLAWAPTFTPLDGGAAAGVVGTF